MPLLTRYTHLKKKWQDGRNSRFSAAQVVGLALELVHKKAKELGQDHVSPTHVTCLKVSGDLQVLAAGAWEHARTCELQVQLPDASLALELARDQRAFLGDCDFNVWHADQYHHAVKKGLDLVGEFNRPRHSALGKIWVETKVFTPAGFDRKFECAKKVLAEEFAQLQAKDQAFGGAMVLAAKVQKSGKAWEKQGLFAEVYTHGAWKDIGPSSTRPAAAGKLSSRTKPSMAEVWKKMEKLVLANSGDCVGLLTHFVEALGLASGNPGKRASTFNKLLCDAGVAGRVEQKQIHNKPGHWPYVASKETFRAILKHL